jgi:hypothetical protein
MSEIVDDLKISNLEVVSNLGVRLSGDAAEIKTTQADATLAVTADGDLSLASTTGNVNIETVNPAGQIILDSSAVVVGITGGAMGFYGGGVIAKPSSFGDDTIVTAGGGAAVLVDTTFTGGVGGVGGVGAEAYTIGDIVRALKNLGLLRATVPT